jgi:hypothetical protein
VPVDESTKRCILPCLYGYSLPFLTALRVTGRPTSLACPPFAGLATGSTVPFFVSTAGVCPTLRSLAPDLTTFTRLDELGLEVVGQRLEPDRAVLACRAVEPDQWCRRCGGEGLPRDTVVRRLAHEPFGWRPTTLEVTVRPLPVHRVCGHVWRQDTSTAAAPRGKLSRRVCGGRWKESCAST